MTVLWEEHRLNDNASSSPFLSLMQTWTYRSCDQPLFGALQVNNSHDKPGYKTSILKLSLIPMVKSQHKEQKILLNCTLTFFKCFFHFSTHFIPSNLAKNFILDDQKNMSRKQCGSDKGLFYLPSFGISSCVRTERE